MDKDGLIAALTLLGYARYHGDYTLTMYKDHIAVRLRSHPPRAVVEYGEDTVYIGLQEDAYAEALAVVLRRTHE